MSSTTPENIETTQNTPDELRARFHEDEANYMVMNGFNQAYRGKGDVWDTDYVLEKYVASTDHVIGMLDGSIGERDIVDPNNPELSQEKPDVVIWLDKSARPVSWFVDAFWDQFAEEGAEKPEDEFLNIDRVNWFVKQGYPEIDAKTRLGPKDFDINKVKHEELSRIRAIFTIGDLSEDNWEEEVWNLPTRLDGKNILIIDEVKNKGGSLFIATEILRKAIPDSTVSGDYFWDTGYYMPGGGNDQKMESAPVWYHADKGMGRGVGEVSMDYRKNAYEKDPSQENLKKMIGSLALSAPHHDAETYETIGDSLASRLMHDISYLSHAVANGKVFRTPHKDRPSEQHSDILAKQGLTLKQFTSYRAMRSAKPRIPIKK